MKILACNSFSVSNMICHLESLFYFYVAGTLFFLLYCTLMSLLASYTAATAISVMHKSSLAALIASKVGND